KLPQNQWGKAVLMISTVSPILLRESAAPPHPELLEMTMANLSSWAPAQRAALPSRECPKTMILLLSIFSSVSIKSIALLSPQAQAPMVPHSPEEGVLCPSL